jgi:hypothetical protein
MLLNSRPENSERCALSGKTLRAVAPILLTLHLFECDGGVEPAKFSASPAATVQDNRRDSVQEKIDRIVENGSKSPVPPQTTVFTEDEVNQMLRVQMKESIPNGLSDPHVRLNGNNILVARVIVDLDEYKRRRQERGSLGPLTLLSGRVPVTVRGVLHTRDRHGQIKLEGADVNGIPLPPALVREMIAALSRSRGNPEGYDIEKPFVLPANIRHVTINRKEAVATQ